MATMISDAATVMIARPVGEVFAFVNDFAQSARWLEGCVSVTQTSPGPRAVGSTLHYVHSRGEMDGAVSGYEKDRRLAMEYTDRVFDVAIDLGFTPTGAGTTVVQRCTITPKTFIARLMSPLIRRGNSAQVTRNMARLKSALEQPA